MRLRYLVPSPSVAFAIALALSCLSSKLSAAPFPTEDDDSPGMNALRYNRQADLWTRLDVGAEDGRVKTSPPDATTYDRRLETFASVGANAVFNKSFGLRLFVEGDVTKRRQEETQAPTQQVDQTFSSLAPAVDLTYVTEKGLELFGGVMEQIDPATTAATSSANGVSSTHSHLGSVTAARFGVIRRSEAWDGGLYYIVGAEKSRQVNLSAFDHSQTVTTDDSYIPSRAAVVGQVRAAASVWDFELAFVQARGVGPKDNEGNSTLTDYLDLRIGNRYPINNNVAVRSSLAYQSQSYARSAFISLDTIPVQSLKIAAEFGPAAQCASVGVFAGYGKDGQSLPEFNAQYQMVALALTFGLHKNL